MRRRVQPWFMVLLVLLVVGIVITFLRSPSSLLVPLIVFAVVFLLYKYPPGRMRRKRAADRPHVRSRAAEQRFKTKSGVRKPAPFRVIEGGKDDDNLPKYH